RGGRKYGAQQFDVGTGSAHQNSTGTPRLWTKPPAAPLGMAFLAGRLGFGLFESLVQGLGLRVGIREGTEGARADRRNALTRELVRALVHGIASMATDPVPAHLVGRHGGVELLPAID